MRRRLVTITVWTARVGGWTMVLSLVIYVAWNHEGIAVRGQLARLNLTSERGQALRALLARAGLEGRVTEWSDSHCPAITYVSPLEVLPKRPSLLWLNRQVDFREPSKDFYLCFAADGRVAGAPLELEGITCHVVGPIYPPLFEAGGSHYLNLTFCGPGPSATTTPSTLRDNILNVFKIDLPRSFEVFRLGFSRTGGLTPILTIDEDEQGHPVIHLAVWPTRSANGSTIARQQTVAGFTWDESLQRFVGPERDPQGQWEVLPPLSEGEALEE